MQPQSEHLTRWIFISTKVFEQPIGTLTKRLAVKPLRTTLWLPHSGQQSLSDGVWIFKTILLLSQRISQTFLQGYAKSFMHYAGIHLSLSLVTTKIDDASFIFIII